MRYSRPLPSPMVNCKPPLLLAIAGLLAGCATGMSQQECEVADWYTIGFEDGSRGLPEASVSGHRKSCAEHGIRLDLDAYRSGRQAGLEGYCQPGNAYNLGRKGRGYQGVCPSTVEPAFLDAYGAGKSLYALEQDVRHLRKSLHRKQARMESIDVEMRDVGLELVAKGVPTERRVVLLDTLRKLGEERNETRDLIAGLEVELANKQAQLDQLYSASAY